MERASHLGHAVRQVGWDSRQTLPPAVHYVVAAAAHGGAGAGRQAAELGGPGVRLAWGEREREGVRGQRGMGFPGGCYWVCQGTYSDNLYSKFSSTIPEYFPLTERRMART